MVLKVTIEEVLAKDEKQIFDRKSIQIRPADLSETILILSWQNDKMTKYEQFQSKRIGLCPALRGR